MRSTRKSLMTCQFASVSKASCAETYPRNVNTHGSSIQYVQNLSKAPCWACHHPSQPHSVYTPLAVCVHARSVHWKQRPIRKPCALTRSGWSVWRIDFHPVTYTADCSTVGPPSSAVRTSCGASYSSIVPQSLPEILLTLLSASNPEERYIFPEDKSLACAEKAFFLRFRHL